MPTPVHQVRRPEKSGFLPVAGSGGSVILFSIRRFPRALRSPIGPCGRGSSMTAEQIRLDEARAQKAPWKKWGPYLSERVFGGTRQFQEDPHWRDYVLFYDYFHGDNGAGLGAGHQTGWTGLIARTMHLFATRTAEQFLELGKAAAVVETEAESEQAAGPARRRAS
jgi:hypothetical protein